MTSPSGYNSYQDGDIQVVAITSCNPAKRTAAATGRGGMALTIDVGAMFAGILTFPAAGEQWFVQRVGNVWRLMAKLGFQDARLNNVTALVPGSTHIGGGQTITLYGQVTALQPITSPAQIALANITGSPSLSVPNGGAYWTVPFNNLSVQNGNVVSLNATSGDPTGMFRLKNRGFYDIKMRVGMPQPGSSAALSAAIWTGTTTVPYNSGNAGVAIIDASTLPYRSDMSSSTAVNLSMTYYGAANEAIYFTLQQNTNAAQTLMTTNPPPGVSIEYRGDVSPGAF